MKRILVKLERGVGEILAEIIEVPDNYDYWEIDDYISDWLMKYVEVKWEEME